MSVPTGAGGSSPEDDRLRYQQLCEFARYYGNLRFAMFTVFTAILGGLYAVELGDPGKALGGNPLVAFRCAAIFLSILFAFAGWRVSYLIAFYQEEANGSGQGPRSLPLPKGHYTVGKILARLTTVAPFGLSVLFWIWLLVVKGGERLG